MATTIAREKEHLEALSLLTIAPEDASAAVAHVASLNALERTGFLELAGSHHVVVRALHALRGLSEGKNGLNHWIRLHLDDEEARIEHALMRLRRICAELESAGCPTVVMKSLDHYPDLGSDLDLYTTADEEKVRAVFVRKLGARAEARSWGDRLAQKWNFAVPGLPELVEVHARRLGQTGEHLTMARRFVERRVPVAVGGHSFLAPAPEERILMATLQRMYRHFYFRLCDIVNTTALLEAGAVDFAELRRAAEVGGIWPGVATCLRIVSDYVKRYRGAAVALPETLLREAAFGGEKLALDRRFLRIPLVPHGAGLYTRQVAATALRGDMPAALRLSLLPPLAATAAVAFKITGNDKGIW